MNSRELGGAATQISSNRFDHKFFALPANIQLRIQSKIDEMGRRLAEFPHYRMENVDTFRLRVGDYRIIYRCDLARNEIELIALGHRREIYR
jgi:mRNA-degrading endonuclease RelE of RelBE toxin-antitoxin system